MYCYHCGYEIDEHKIEMKQSSFEVVQDGDMSTSIAYVCPRCGHLIKENATEQDIKALTRACHAELQRSRNDVARGMSSLVFGAILLIIGIIFLLLSKKANNQFRVTTTSPEFLVFMVLTIISVILLGLGSVFAIRGFKKQHKYSRLLNDINTKTFVQ